MKTQKQIEARIDELEREARRIKNELDVLYWCAESEDKPTPRPIKIPTPKGLDKAIEGVLNRE